MSNYNIAEYFIYMDEQERKEREIVICNKPTNCDWNLNYMTFFKSTGSSNVSSSWLSNTYFPTNGLACHIEITDRNINISNAYQDHTGLEDLTHVHGHIIKLSDYNRFLKNKEKNEKKGYINSYYEFIELEPFYTFLINKLTYYVTDKDFINTNKDLIIKNSDKYKQFSYYENLIKAITDYFSCEEQIKMSYALSDHNEGLWSWEICNITFADICKERWNGLLPEKINKIKAPDVTKEYLNTDETYNYLVSKNAICDFNVFLNFIQDKGLLVRHKDMSTFFNKYRQSFMIDNSFLIVNKAINYKKQEEKRLQSLAAATPSQYEPINTSAIEINMPPPPPPQNPPYQLPIINEQIISEVPIESQNNRRYTRMSIKKSKTKKNLIGESKRKRSERDRDNKKYLNRINSISRSVKGGYKKMTYKLKKRKTKRSKKVRKIRKVTK